MILSRRKEDSMKRIRVLIAIVLALHITVFYAVVVLLGEWRLSHIKTRREVNDPYRNMMGRWVDMLYRACYLPILGITCKVECDTRLIGTPGIKVIEMNHGSTLEMFLGIRVASLYVADKIVVVGKKELTNWWFSRTFLAKPMLAMNSILLIDRGDREASVEAIRKFVKGVASDESVAILILPEGTRPTASKRAASNEKFGTSFQRVLMPKKGGPWTIHNALQTLDVSYTHVMIMQGLSRPHERWSDIHMTCNGTHWSRVLCVDVPVPETADEYGRVLQQRWEMIDRLLVTHGRT